MNVLAIIYVISGFVLGGVATFLHSVYRHISRRCCRPGCGRLNVRRVSFIIVPQEEGLYFRIRSPVTKKPRWWIRRVVNITFSVCKNHNPPAIRLEKIDMKPISLWHAWWARKFHREQFIMMRLEYKLVISKLFKQLERYGSVELGGDTDTPNLILGMWATFTNQFEKDQE